MNDIRERVSRAILDENETSPHCVDLVEAVINAMIWSPETEAMAIKAVEPIAAEWKRIAEESNPYHGEPLR